MIPKVKAARYVKQYQVWVQFADGTVGTVDLSAELSGPVFEPLKSLSEFRKVTVDPELETLTWPNGADFAPEFLYEAVVARHGSVAKHA